MKLSEYEIQVLNIMLKDYFNSMEIDELCKSEIDDYEYTGAGYFINIGNKILPKVRKVISQPTILGKTGNCRVGFILYLEDHVLTMECHSWGNQNPPEHIREETMSIEVMH